jgi:hypothetical protein
MEFDRIMSFQDEPLIKAAQNLGNGIQHEHGIKHKKVSTKTTTRTK